MIYVKTYFGTNRWKRMTMESISWIFLRNLAISFQ